MNQTSIELLSSHELNSIKKGLKQFVDTVSKVSVNF